MTTATAVNTPVTPAEFREIVNNLDLAGIKQFLQENPDKQFKQSCPEGCVLAEAVKHYTGHEGVKVKHSHGTGWYASSDEGHGLLPYEAGRFVRWFDAHQFNGYGSPKSVGARSILRRWPKKFDKAAA